MHSHTRMHTRMRYRAGILVVVAITTSIAAPHAEATEARPDLVVTRVVVEAPTEPEPEPAGVRKAAEPEPTSAEIAIAVAMEQLGTPYRWAGDEPGGFDCSGLTSYAYAKAGVSLPHNSRAQYASMKRIPLDELEPGDLVFSGWGRIGHVGLYIGDGKMINSPQTGRRVEIAPLRRNLIGAGRPGG